jgi:succinate dehydrogenase / fumarate reductase iron-sulfur subunit
MVAAPAIPQQEPSVAEFTLSKNSVIKKGKVHAPDQGGRLKSFKIYRYDPAL